MKNKKSLGFTLVELLVVISILSILMTIGYFSVQNYVSVSRDSARVTDFANMEKTLGIFKISHQTYPIPDEPIAIYYSGILSWSQGTFGNGIAGTLGNYGNSLPLDPLYNNEYNYSLSSDGKEYQLGGLLENSDSVSLLVDNTYAAGGEQAYVKGTYNGIMLKITDGFKYYFLAIPSIITTTISETDVRDIVANEHIVFNGFRNLPSTYSGIIFDINGGFSYNVNDLVLFSGSLLDLYSYDGVNNLDKSIKYNYTGTPLENNDVYKRIISTKGISSIKKLLQFNFGLNLDKAFNCVDLKDLNMNTDGFYTVDPDGLGGADPFVVYCDMTTDGGGFTKVGGDYITYGDFVSGSGIITEWGSNKTNAIVQIPTPVDEINGYAVHQTGKANSEYEIHFEHISDVKSGYEIRLYLWVTGDINADGSWTGDWNWPTYLKHNPSAGYLFHNRLFYNDGTNSINGPVETLQEKIVDGRLWKYQRVRVLVRKEPKKFNWYIGYDAEGDGTDLYFTGVKIELFYK